MSIQDPCINESPKYDDGVVAEMHLIPCQEKRAVSYCTSHGKKISHNATADASKSCSHFQCSKIPPMAGTDRD